MYVDNDTEKYPRLPLRATDRETFKQWLDGYDTAIRYVDDQIAKIIGKLKDAGVYEDTVVIISADHGENQGELGIYGEHGTADVGTCRIPMIIKWPAPGTPGSDGKAYAAGMVDDGLHYNVDWAPTVMEMIGKPGMCSKLWDGQSYAATLKDGTPAGRDELIVSQCCHVCQRGVRFDKWMYIRTYCDGFHPFEQDMLFDLEADPMEQVNVADKYPDVTRDAAFRLMNWHDAQMQKMAANCSDSTDPLWTVIREGGPQHAIFEEGRSPLPKYLKRLEETGRTDGATALREKYPALA